MPETETKPNVPVKTYNTSLPKLDLSASNLQIEWSSWLLQYKIFLRATNLESENDKRKVSLLLHHMGGEVLEIFKSFNLDLDNVTHEALVKKFGDYFSPKKNITMERNKFFNKKQNTDQGIMEFVTELKNLAKSCEFTETDSIIRDIFICNMRSEYNYIKEKLLEDGELTLQKSIEIAKSMEASRQRVSQLDSSEPQVLKVSTNPSQNFRRSRSKSNHRYQDKNHGNSDHRKSSQGSVCQKCGYNHRFKCPAYGKTCAKCGQRNHFAKMCKSLNNVNNIESEYSECGDSESNQYQDFFVGSVSSSIWEVPVEINGNVIQAQVDTGSQVNIISRYKYNILSLDLNLINSCHDKALSDVPCRLQRMMLRLQVYDLNVIHIPGKYMYIADTLSRANIKDNHLPEETDRILDSFNKELRVHTNFLVRSINVTDQKLEQIKSNTDNDHVLSKVKGYVLDGWPAQKNKVEDTVRKFYNFKDDLHVINDIVFKGRSLVIPTSLQKEMLERMHIGHLGISKTKQLVRGSIYWPGMNEDISNFIENCPVCLKYAKSNCKQPILPHNIPDLPWQKLGKCHQLSRIWLVLLIVLIHQCVVSTRVLVIHLCVVHYSPPQNSGVYKEVNEYHLHWTKP
ncbi:hypothetical protein M8J77_007836 [Diaphorina citri]|nr:hypothetical protein M8J77_007836 [Diaphorina citri]